MIRAFLIDIEGTISPISFVKDVLFPYSKEKVCDYLKNNEKYLDTLLKELKEITKEEDISLICEKLKEFIDLDLKLKPLKDLQGLIWEEGFLSKVFVAPIYEDAYRFLEKAKEKGYELYIYSSGSLKAQDLFFSNTNYGNIKYFFNGFFDTSIGSKKDPKSYLNILKETKKKSNEVIFLTDSLDEINASREANIESILVDREDKLSFSPKINSFDELYKLIKL